MRAKAGALLLCMGLARLAPAFGGTQLRWMGGTIPWDTVPGKELDVELRSAFGDGRPGLGAGLSAGVFDQLQAAAQWDQPLDGIPGRGEASLVAREQGYPSWRPALAVYVRSAFGAVAPEARPGLVAAIEPWDHSFTVNAEAGSSGNAVRLGYWTPYVTSFLRLGMEGQWAQGQAEWVLLPQAAVNLFGDVSFTFGGRRGAAGDWTYLFNASYILFPSP
jgi:hypothetical protein